MFSCQTGFTALSLLPLAQDTSLRSLEAWETSRGSGSRATSFQVKNAQQALFFILNLFHLRFGRANVLEVSTRDILFDIRRRAALCRAYTQGAGIPLEAEGTLAKQQPACRYESCASICFWRARTLLSWVLRPVLPDVWTGQIAEYLKVDRSLLIFFCSYVAGTVRTHTQGATSPHRVEGVFAVQQPGDRCEAIRFCFNSGACGFSNGPVYVYTGLMLIRSGGATRRPANYYRTR